MSGVEVASLALTVLPLLLTAAKHYDDCLRPFVRYEKFASEAKKYYQKLDIQRSIYRNECLLLEDVVEHELASSMLVRPTHTAWLDRGIDDQVVWQLGDSKEAYIAIVNLIEQHLQEIDGKHKTLEAAVDRANQVFTSLLVLEIPMSR